MVFRLRIGKILRVAKLFMPWKAPERFSKDKFAMTMKTSSIPLKELYPEKFY